MSKNQLLTVIICLGLIAGIIAFANRYSAESRNRQVELVIDYSDAQALANTSSRTMSDVLRQLGAAGITTVAVTEDTLSTLVANDVIDTPQRDGDTTVLTFAPGFPGQMARVEAMLAHKAPGLTVNIAGPNTLRVGAPWPQFSGIPIGLDSRTVAAVRQSGLLIAPRLYNYTGVTPTSIIWELDQVQKQCTPAATGPLIFAGAAVLGNRTQIPAVAAALETDKLTYGSVEMGKMFGDDTLSRLAGDRTVRVHSIGNDEMGLMDEPTAIDRFVLAVRERNIRVCYVRLFLSGLTTEPGGDVLSQNVRFIQRVARGVQAAYTSTAGPLTLGRAHPFRTDPTPPRWQRMLMGIGVMAGALLLIRLFTGLRGRPFWTAFAVCMLVGLALGFPGHSVKGREILALLSACAFPTLGLCALALPVAAPSASQRLGLILRRAFSCYARMTAITGAGIIFIVGLLSGRLFLLKVDEFLGVKLVLVAPVLLTAAYYGLGLSDLPQSAGWRTRWRRIVARLQSVYAQPLLLGQIVVGVIILIVLAILVARSGNDPGMGVSGAEMKMRELLNKYLWVRPRTKEFLFGHPALYFALAAAASGRFTKCVMPLIVVGAIGQASLLDTFCHLHTPLLISVLRGLIGWALGAAVGAVVFILVSRVAERAAPIGDTTCAPLA